LQIPSFLEGVILFLFISFKTTKGDDLNRVGSQDLILLFR